MRRLSCLVLLAALLWTPLSEALDAGAAKLDITPEPGVPLNGYLERQGRGATGAHDPLWARCLYLDDGETEVYLVTLDIIVINPALYERVLELAPPNIDRKHIILVASHTHSGFGGLIEALPYRQLSGPFMPDLLDETAHKVVEVMRMAYDKRQRATLGYGVTDQEALSENRRYPGGPTDPQIGVVRVDDADGRAIAILTSFAAHPTTAPFITEPYVFSADYPGYYYTYMEELSDTGCVAMFLPGALGDQRRGNPEGATGWDRPDSIGKLLATRAKAVANDINPDKAQIRVGYTKPRLPANLAPKLLPDRAVLQTLELDGLLMTFFPGEPTVEIGLTMREKALERGYDAHFAVSFANDYLFYFIPRYRYEDVTYESALCAYGPAIDEWLYEQFGTLMTRGEAEAGPHTTQPLPVTSIPGGKYVKLEGSAYDIGHQRGELFAELLKQDFQNRIVDNIANGTLRPASLGYEGLPGFISRNPLALYRLAIGSRPLLARISDNAFNEVLGIARGADMPFDSLWMLQCLPTMRARTDIADFYSSPFCTMFAAVGDRAGLDDLLIGRNLDWPDDESAVVYDIDPDNGFRFVQIGFSWNAGLFSAMNERGLVICIERVEPLGEPRVDGAPLEMVIRNIMQMAANTDDAVSSLTNVVGMRGYHVLVADPDGPDAVVVEYDSRVRVRKASRGFLLGADPRSGQVDEDAQVRYARVASLLQDERIISRDEIMDVLNDCARGAQTRKSIRNAWTRHSVVFEPRTRKVHVAFPSEDGGLGEYTVIALDEEAE